MYIYIYIYKYEKMVRKEILRARAIPRDALMRKSIIRRTRTK